MRTLAIIPDSRIEGKIFLLRGKKVMLDKDLAELYGAETKNLNKTVKRNIERFPADFMFQLNAREMEIWKSQIVTSKSDLNLRLQIGTSSHGGQRYRYHAFTEQGVAMLSSVLNSRRAIQVNIQIIRTFTKLRELIATNKELREKIEKLESKYDQQFKVVFEAIKQLLAPPTKPIRKIGFNI
ncbi:MAG: DNA-binding protein [Candidatus Taylorbacteria bacterium RIFCSPHIGHO2_02_FULL_47_18]|uniref:DNA-binding protein n=1 Tax=Candidatus Taylorbacteria bacterium RIFCSPLOWO2_01_FULL_48_100 TaxID=1802322 RepID=A0A1G2NEM3_9BACT|nr:MAG: DNA-binding protein [Candidatus Taylorbacteria bacterium RIFCSPHIGHO2_01_FULL_48_38]OHA28204.1 MAG: DNA-binding protein [Candidatus Taylorbacteria bacterium RIFCSPHIGHO2_02_FULL_47_18]OHA33909.1 MAG: DNA-binding protein [Candidatus Taylorbacteria bacterium RIFCSPLOWO2_01_FULL_48_100]OHA40884.1 MAG: DNA-binding protein [Candidatus Taylorbacteria bacterium RIFCSPLOWO2_02_FULL_48_16]OHA45104.1 MAG: DNA-binding protein [Candidatus Taylorbacteria bacterium RIFCSPLOWO2_12_FULL_48_11]